MAFKIFKVQLNQKREKAIAELMAIGYDRNEAAEILDIHHIISSDRPIREVDSYEGTNELGT